MARDTMTYESYEPDSFDNPPKGPVGVHRGARSVMARLCPFIVVILVAALCGVGAWAWISGEYKNVVGGSSQTATTSKSDSSSKAETKNSTKDDSSSTSTDSSKDSTSDSAKSDTDSDTTSSNENQNSDQQSQQSEAIATVNKATQVRVVNARNPRICRSAGRCAADRRLHQCRGDQSERHIAGFFRGVVSE